MKHKRRVKFHIDNYTSIGDKEVITGWAVDKCAGAIIEIECFNSSGYKIECLVEKGIRTDVAQHFPNVSTQDLIGFKIVSNIEKICNINFLINSNVFVNFDIQNMIEKNKMNNEKKWSFNKLITKSIEIFFGKKLWRNPGLLIHYFKIFLRKTNQRNEYRKWLGKNTITSAELKNQREHIFPVNPLISIIMPTYNTPVGVLKEALDSVCEQTYTNWEICIADGSNHDDTKKALNAYAKNRKINIKFLKENMGIAKNTNEAIDIAKGEFCAFLDHDDAIEPNALFEFVKVINDNPDVDLIYTDEDKISEDSKLRFDPFFKSDWNPELLRGHNYITHFVCTRLSLVHAIGGIREGFEGAQDYDFLLRFSEKARKIIHIPKILYHWRVVKGSVAGNPNAKLYAYESGKRAIEEHLKRIGRSSEVELGSAIGTYRVKYIIPKEELVSIIVLSHNNPDLLEKCINSIIEKTKYQHYEIIILENRSMDKAVFELYNKFEANEKIKIFELNEEFNFSRMNNYARTKSNGKYLLFLNNDTEILHETWLDELVSLAQHDENGIVGAKLYYSDLTIQHAGVILGIGGIAGHSHKGFSAESMGYFFRLILPQNVSAVTGACLMIKSELFDECGGFDENLKVALNDIDLCLAVQMEGKKVVWTPHSCLIHYESKTRGYEDTPKKKQRFSDEKGYLKMKWGLNVLKYDPFYNVNLSRTNEDFSLNI